MDKPYTSPSTESRLSHQKRLHFILFVDAAQTRSFSLKMQHAWWLLGAIIFFVAASATTTVVLVKTYAKLNVTQHHLVEVKRALFAETVADRNILSSEFIGDGYKDEQAVSVQAIVDELSQKTSSTPVTVTSMVANKKSDVSLRALSTSETTVSTTQPLKNTSHDIPPNATNSISSSLPLSKVTEKPVPQVELPQSTASTQLSGAQDSPVKFENVSVADDDDEPGTINISFDLQNVSGRMLTGWVCAAVTLKNSEGGQLLRAAPTSVSLSSNSQEITTCKGGEFVKFSRLRPTVLSTSGNQNGVEKVVVYFTDGTSGRQHSNK